MKDRHDAPLLATAPWPRSRHKPSETGSPADSGRVPTSHFENALGISARVFELNEASLARTERVAALDRREDGLVTR